MQENVKFQLNSEGVKIEAEGTFFGYDECAVGGVKDFDLLLVENYFIIMK